MSDEYELNTDKLVKRELDNAEECLERGLVGEAEKDLNRAAARFRELGLENTSPRYRRVSSHAAHLRIDGEYKPNPLDCE